ncbi:MAG: DUF4982 domain-containing protein [Eubacterium sp.]|nr:DUF4982 domain-containing protein [Eubacterium sp.]
MRTLINDQWSFAEYPSGTTAAEALAASRDPSSPFRPVDLPHDWMISDTKNLYRSSVGVYTRTLSLDPEKHNSIFFEGVYMRTTVYLNGEEIFFWPYGYTSFEVDLTPYQKPGENHLLVHVDYRNPNTRWYSGAGIFRDVWLLSKDPVHITEGGVYFHAQPCEGVVEGPERASAFLITIDTEVVGPSAFTKGVTVRHILKDQHGRVTAESQGAQELYTEPVSGTQIFSVSGVTLWDIENPYLYTLETTVFCKGHVTDSLTQKVGFRTLLFTPEEGFFLNGCRTKLKGACMHHDLGALGAAFNRKAARRQLEKLKALGINAVRTSHNPPAVGLMELADEMGFLVNSDAFDMWEQPKTENDYGIFFHEWCERDVESWIRRDRNHPSVIMWSCGNEIPDTNQLSAIPIARRLRDAIRRNDPRHNAYTTIASNFVAWENAQKVQDLFELSGYNYLESVYDEHHAKFPHWCIYGSETASTVQSRGIYHFPKSRRLLTYEDQQCSSLDNCSTNWGAKNVQRFITDDRDRPYSAGQFIWTGWDYIGEPTPYFSKNSFFGHIDTAGFLKDTAYILKAAWVPVTDDPFVHISPYWDFNEGQMIDIEIYSNAPRVALFFNDEPVGEKKLDQKRDMDFSAHFSLPYRTGVLRAEAYDVNGKCIARDETESFGDPVSIRLAPEYDTLLANGEDLQFVEITVLDAEGREVRNARNRMQVTVNGAARLVGLDNGDSTDYDPYQCCSRRLFSGKLMAILASTEEAGEVTMDVTSPGLAPVQLSFSTTPAEKRRGSSGSFRIPSVRSEDRVPEVPIRKLALSLSPGCSELNPELPETELSVRIEPANATYSEVRFKAVTAEGIESRAVKIETIAAEEDTSLIRARVTAVSDGSFRLVASADNDKDHPEVLSELEMSVTGYGNACLDPYTFIHGCQYAESSKEALLSFRGSVNFGDENVIRFDNVDFGDYGSDLLYLSLFSFRNEEPVEIWEGESELLCSATYSVPSEYNVLQEDSFRLSKRLRGICSLTFRFRNGFVLGGFRMERQEKAYGLISATEHGMITGDSYRELSEGIFAIGNNVDIEFPGMRFSKGVSAVTITGRARKNTNPVHIRFFTGEEVIKRVVDFPVSEEIQTLTFPLEDFRGEGKINFIFLPGSDFDLVSFCFKEA